MIKHYCDICGKEIKQGRDGKYNYNKLYVSYGESSHPKVVKDEVCDSCLHDVQITINETISQLERQSKKETEEFSTAGKRFA